LCYIQHEAAHEEPSRCLSEIVLRYVLAHIILSALNELETIAPIVAVQGNVEYAEVMMKLPVRGFGNASKVRITPTITWGIRAPLVYFSEKL
jgi:hypothetical protein